MSTEDHPPTDGQTEHTNRSFHNWSGSLPMTEFAINNDMHASTGHPPFFVNAVWHSHLPNMIGVGYHCKREMTYGCARKTA
ncbi:reverse transcriptase [Phytophthora megakarya]|uniref:Reverse transcriptase n=1 Tax=Phytophthora megakarya TaxID=4795 RepID=A0A225W7S0_9STRA|nr:reverse transcriptase [Phytophthora megakarya]